MNHLLTTKLLLLIFLIAILPLSIANAQAPPIAPAQTADPDPVADADFYLTKAAAKISEIQKFVDSIRGSQYTFRQIGSSQRDAWQAFETLKLAKTQIDLIPDDANSQRLIRHERLLRRAWRLSDNLKLVQTSLLASLSPKSFPNLKADASRLRGIGTMFANIDSFDTDPELAATIVRQLSAAQQEANRITTKYDWLIQQTTLSGLQVAGLDRYFKSKQKSFEAIVKQQQQVLPKRIKNNLSHAAASLRQQKFQRGENDKKQVGLRRQLRNIETDLKLLEAIDPKASEPELSTLLLVHRKHLLELLQAVQKTEPADVYAGNDREVLTKALKRIGVKPNVSDIRIPEKIWTRRTYWQFDDLQWVEIDRSVLSVYLLAKDSKNASPSWNRFLLIKDHLNKDKVTARLDEWFSQ